MLLLRRPAVSPRGASDVARGPRRGYARSTEPLLSTISTCPPGVVLFGPPGLRGAWSSSLDLSVIRGCHRVPWRASPHVRDAWHRHLEGAMSLVSSAARRRLEGSTGLCHPVRWECGHQSPEGGAGDRVDVVEVDDAVRRYAVGRCQRQIGDQPSLGAGQGSHNGGDDPVGHRVAREDQDGAVGVVFSGQPVEVLADCFAQERGSVGTEFVCRVLDRCGILIVDAELRSTSSRFCSMATPPEMVRTARRGWRTCRRRWRSAAGPRRRRARRGAPRCGPA